jgi:DNA-binding winged helix-turn-helix (wHTH) protein/Tol biopolymer transport system component
MSQKTSHLYAFGPFLLNPSECLLMLDGKPVPLAPKAFEALIILIESAGHLVDKDELMKRLWPDSFVEETNVAKHVSLLRKALSEATNGREYIETIPKRGYRFVEEVREVSDVKVDSEPQSLPAVKQTLPVTNVVGKKVSYYRVLAILGLLVGAGIVLWSRSNPSPVVPELKQRQLTTNSSENSVSGGSISPDGEYLAYADLQGIHIKQIETGEARTIPQPGELKGQQVNWGIATNWVPDGSRFIANANVPGKPSSIWVIPVAGEPRKLRDDGSYAWAVARNAPWVAFTANPAKVLYRELWRMGPNGEQSAKLYEGDEDHGFFGADWSPDGQRLSYGEAHQFGDKLLADLENRALHGGQPVVVVRDDFQDWTWLPDGRILHIRPEQGDGGESCNFWTTLIDGQTGEVVGPPKRLTNWAGFCLEDPSASANGKRLAFRKLSAQGTVYVADLSSDGMHIKTPSRLTLNEGQNYPIAWTPDSKSVVSRSYRDGQWSIFKQSLNQDSAEAIAKGADAGDASATASPNGDWVLYLSSSDHGDSSSQVYRLMRVPTAGGRPELVLTAPIYGRPVCAKSPASLCLFAEYTPDHRQLVFTTFDPGKGRGGELIRFDTDPIQAKYVWDLSSDGSRIAIVKYSTGVINILPLGRQASQEIVVKGWNSLFSLNWAADGKNLYASSQTKKGSVLLRVDPTGKASVLWERRGSIAPWNRPFGEPGELPAPWALPSPDGRHLAIYNWSLSANMWMLENF